MATALNVTTNYVGEVAGGYIAEMIKEANAISGDFCDVRPDIVSPTFIRKIQGAEGFVDYACGWNPSGSITLSERELTPKKIKWDLEFCKEDFRQLWTAKQMGFSAHNDNLPADEKEAILDHIAKIVARKVDVDFWEGSGGAGDLNGLVPKLLADANVIDVATPVAITDANVVAEVNSFIDAIPDTVLSSPNLRLVVSTNVLRALRRAYNTLAITNGVFVTPDEVMFEGYTLKEAKGLASNTMIAYVKENVVFGTGLLADHNEVRVKDMDETDLSGVVRMKVVLTGDIQYAFGGDIVLYRA